MTLLMVVGESREAIDPACKHPNHQAGLIYWALKAVRTTAMNITSTQTDQAYDGRNSSSYFWKWPNVYVKARYLGEFVFFPIFRKVDVSVL